MRLHGSRFRQFNLVVIFVLWVGLIPGCGGGASSSKPNEQQPSTNSEKPCPICGGNRVVGSFQQTPFDPTGKGGGGGQFITSVCPLCAGTGKAR